MSHTLVKVDRSDNESRSFALDTSETLDAVRAFLTRPPQSFMGAQDEFLNGNSIVDRGSEPLIQLSRLLGTGTTLRIGVAGDIGGDDDVQRYNRMSEADKRVLFENLEIRRGLTVDEHGFRPTFKDLYTWRQGRLPMANMPTRVTELSHAYTFTEVTHTLETSGVQSGSLSLTTPWGGGEANYKYAETHKVSQELVTQYMTERYLSNKVDLDVSARNVEPHDGFLRAVRQAVEGKRGNINGYQDLVQVLNEWGWYVPLRYTLGGALYATKRTQVSKYSEARGKSETFGGSFKAAFKGIGGGAAYENANTEDTTQTSSVDTGSTVILQMGGKAGTNKDFKEWNESLNKAIAWKVIAYQRLLPSLMLLSGVDNKSLTTAVALLQQFHTYPQVASLQKFIDVRGYELTLAGMLAPVWE